MNEESERSKVFQPKGKLAWQAMVCEARAQMKLPLIWWLCVFGCTSGFAIATNLTNQFYLHRPVSVDRWVVSALLGPLGILTVFAVTYCLYRFARPLSLSPNGLVIGRRPLSGWFTPVDCRIFAYSEAARLVRLSIYCRSRWASQPRAAYSAVTDDLISAREFAAAFHQRYPSSHE